MWLAVSLPVAVTGDGFTVRAEPGLAGVAARVAAQVPGDLDAIYADLDGLPRPPAVDIRIVRDAASLSDVAPGGARVPAWADGVAFPRYGVVAVALRRGARDIDLPSTVTHELAHLALGAALGGRAPRWLDEGFAYLHSADMSLDRARALAGIAWGGHRYALRDLAHSFPAGHDAAARAYVQAYDFVAYLAKRGRFADDADDGNRAPFRQFLREIARTGGVDRAAIEAFGLPLELLEREWYEHVRRTYLWSLVGLFSALVWCVAAGLLVVGWLRRRRENRRRLAQWAIAEAAEDGALAGVPPGGTEPPWLH